MVQRYDRPYWASWLSWNLLHRFIPHKAEQRKAAWLFAKALRNMPHGSLAIDGGANVGNVTAVLLRRGLEVHAFEPDPVAGDAFERRFAGKPNVRLHRAALGTAASKTLLYRTRQFATRQIKATVSSSIYPRAAHGETDTVEVEVVDLPAFISNLGRRVDLLKLDIEGAEVAILNRIVDAGLHGKIGLIFAETHERHSAELAERTRALRQRIAREGITNIYLDWR